MLHFTSNRRHAAGSLDLCSPRLLTTPMQRPIGKGRQRLYCLAPASICCKSALGVCALESSSSIQIMIESEVAL